MPSAAPETALTLIEKVLSHEMNSREEAPIA
jgi:hypothetical protein